MSHSPIWCRVARPPISLARALWSSVWPRPLVVWWWVLGLTQPIPPVVWCAVLVGWCGGGFRLFDRPRPPVVWWGVLGDLTPPLPPYGVVWCAVVVGCGFQV